MACLRRVNLRGYRVFLWSIQLNEIIKIDLTTIAGESVQTCNARNLHKFLEVRQDFSEWTKAQIGRARLVENRDYIAVPQKGDAIINDLRGLRPGLDYTINYHLTIEAAKHVAMMSGTDKGYEVREYFLECERIAKESHQQLPKDYLSALKTLVGATEAKIALEAETKAQKAKLEIDTPKAEFTPLWPLAFLGLVGVFA